jgi:hypothetical protein
LECHLVKAEALILSHLASSKRILNGTMHHLLKKRVELGLIEANCNVLPSSVKERHITFQHYSLAPDIKRGEYGRFLRFPSKADDYRLRYFRDCGVSARELGQSFER